MSAPFQAAALALLRGMGGLEELHLHDCFTGQESEVTFLERLHKETRLPDTLREFNEGIGKKKKRTNKLATSSKAPIFLVRLMACLLACLID